MDLKPTHTAVKNYYAALGQFDQLQIDHEGAVRSAFQFLLSNCARKFDWTLVPEYSIARKGQAAIRVDGAVLDTFKLRMGAWEAKDTHDDLEKEVKHKLGLGYPRDNIIFQAPERAILYQNGVRQGLDEDITDAKNLVELLKTFFEWERPHHEEWESAVKDFKAQLPNIAKAAKELIDKERRANKKFVEKFDAFYALCRQAINPNLSEDAVEGMLIQHLLTERIFRKVFNNPDFARRNVIASELERVIDALTSRKFNRAEFLSGLDHFYKAIELNAESAEGYTEKQQFLNSVYERFFQGYSPKEADTHGIVYTPQPIVDFMVRSVEEILKKEFGKSLSDKGVHILDPFVGTGNFITRVMKEIKTSALPYKYEHELHCNEVTLMPYYIASMNIEHEYVERTGEYRPFPGICLVDTFELAEAQQRKLFTEENTRRVDDQKHCPIFVIIGNPPYNAWQEDERDESKNRKYPALDSRVASTYGKESEAQNKSALSDPYVKAFRWAADRVGQEGVVAFVSNNSFAAGKAFDGMRVRLANEFSSVMHLDLKGDARTSGEERKKQGGNIFDDAIKVRVGITLLQKHAASQSHVGIYVYSVPDYQKAETKRQGLDDAGSFSNVPLRPLKGPIRQSWIGQEGDPEFADFVLLCGEHGIFKAWSNGAKTNRDLWVYAFGQQELASKVQTTINDYNDALAKWIGLGRKKELLPEVYAERVPWSETLKRKLQNCKRLQFDPQHTRMALYRPFDRRFMYFDNDLVERKYLTASIFPDTNSEQTNRAFLISEVGFRSPFACLAVSTIPDIHLCGSDAFQSFPVYFFDIDGRRENITNWARQRFRANYGDESIAKWDIFHYVYAVLHHPTYRERYAANLKRELPRIPFVAGRDAFWKFVEAGRRLAEIHVEYEKQPEYPLERIENPEEKLNWRVEKMRLSKDKTTLVYNDWLTLKGVPPATYEYRLGNRSALEWVVDQYQVSTDKRSGIKNDPNRDDDPQYIVRLIGRVITVSLETVQIVKSLPELVIDECKAAGAK